MQKGDYLVAKSESSKSELSKTIETEGPVQCTPGAPEQPQDEHTEYECMICLEIKLAPNGCVECGAIVCQECTKAVDHCP